jgi:peptidoglycan/LPS O-acetylase OafA/YrhL
MTQRRYDIDWLRVIAIGLLIVYHSAIAFQSWGGLIGFIQDRATLEWIWYPMAMLNMWRIPILFFVSGMGVYFSMRKRTLPKLLLERTQRILIPFIFGIIAIVPLHIFLWQKYYYQDLHYKIEMSHLWFLANIIVYTSIIAPLAYGIQKSKLNAVIQKIRKQSHQVIVFLITYFLLSIETGIIKPDVYTLYAYNIHGWGLGMIAFTMGFYIMSLGSGFWDSFKNWKWVYLGIAIALYINRLFDANLSAAFYLNSLETSAWIFSIFGFFYLYARRSNKTLRYLSKAAYPVYIIHMFVQLGISSILFPLYLPININFILLTSLTLGLSLAIYHMFIKPWKWIRPLFGLKFNESM